MSETKTTYRLLDRDSGTFVRLYGGGGQEMLTIGGDCPVYETSDLSDLHEVRLRWGDSHPGYNVPSSIDLEGEVDIVRTVTTFSSIGNERVVASQEAEIVELAIPVPVAILSSRPYATMPEVLRRHYVPEDVAAGLSGRGRDDVSFLVLCPSAQVAEGDFIASANHAGFAFGPVSRIALIQPLPDDWPASAGTPLDARLALVDKSQDALAHSVGLLSVASVSAPAP